jgi:hypothetical protein
MNTVIRIQLPGHRKVKVYNIHDNQIQKIKRTKKIIMNTIVDNYSLCKTNIKLDFLQDSIREANLHILFENNSGIYGFLTGTIKNETIIITCFASVSGYGKKFMNQCFECLPKLVNIKSFETNAVYSVIGFYIKCGFELLNPDNIPLLLTSNEIETIRKSESKKMKEIYDDPVHRPILTKIYNHNLIDQIEYETFEDAIQFRAFNYGIKMVNIDLSCV